MSKRLKILFVCHAYFPVPGGIELLATRLAENLVFIELKRRYKQPVPDIYYWKSKGGMEVDFVIKEGLDISGLIQVCWNVSDGGTKKREVRSLLKAMDEFGLKEGFIITEDFEGEEEIGGKKIVYTPLWKWLLES